jgi:hypothetical protein
MKDKNIRKRKKCIHKETKGKTKNMTGKKKK